MSNQKISHHGLIRRKSGSDDEDNSTVVQQQRNSRRSSSLQRLPSDDTINLITSLAQDFRLERSTSESDSSLSTIDDYVNEYENNKKKFSSSSGDEDDSIIRPKKTRSNLFAQFQTEPKEEIDVDKYMTKREMTPLQERWNAITIIPNPVYCLYFILTAQWVTKTTIQPINDDELLDKDYNYYDPGPFQSFLNALFGADENGCLQSTWWHSMPSLPPLPVIAIAIGICVHAPFSMLYHWTYAHTLPVGAARTMHWSRRMDQSMIHFASACMSYGTSGSYQYFIVNVLYNIDCIRRQFKRTVRPRLNQIRIFISMIAYTIPVLKIHGDINMFVLLWIVLFVSGYFFIKYPVGGWSHSIFHLIIAMLPPLLMIIACKLYISQQQIYTGIQCYEKIRYN